MKTKHDNNSYKGYKNNTNLVTIANDISFWFWFWNPLFILTYWKEPRIKVAEMEKNIEKWS